MSGGPDMPRPPSSWLPGPSRSDANRSKASRDSQKSSTPQPSSIGPAEWKIKPTGGFPSMFMWPWTVSYCSCVPPLNFRRMPTAMAGPLIEYVGGASLYRRGPPALEVGTWAAAHWQALRRVGSPYPFMGGRWTTAIPYGLLPVATVAVVLKVVGSMIDSVLAPWLAT